MLVKSCSQSSVGGSFRWSRALIMLLLRSVHQSRPSLVHFKRFIANRTRLLSVRKMSSIVESNTEAVSSRGPTQTIIEGTVRMDYDSREIVFYNKVQVFNRDLSIQVIKLFAEKRLQEREERLSKKRAKKEATESAPASETTSAAETNPPGIKILDALAASGLRSIRYLKEIPNVSHVTINDLSAEATKQAESNCRLNNVDMSRVTINTEDACMFMFRHRDPREQFDVIDLDPYGTAAPFLDSAVQAVKSGGLLCVTCTDMTVLSGGYPEVCYSKYGSMPVRGKYLHEMSLRILLHTIDATANRYRRHIVPWISISVDFYVRVFVRVFESPSEVKNTMLKRCMVYQAIDCPSFYLHTVGKANAAKTSYTANFDATPSVCEETGGRLKMGGPIWSAPIHDQAIVDEVLQRVTHANDHPDPLYPVQTAKRIMGILTAVSEELKDVVLYYSLPELGSAVQMQTPTLLEFRTACENAGYRVSQFHHDPSAVKTDAPQSFVWDVIRALHKKYGKPELFAAALKDHQENSAETATESAMEVQPAMAEDSEEQQPEEEAAAAEDVPEEANSKHDKRSKGKKGGKKNKDNTPRRHRGPTPVALAILSKPITHNIDYTTIREVLYFIIFYF